MNDIMSESKAIVVVVAYRFITLEKSELPIWRTLLREAAERCVLKGTVLLSQEGINLMLAGTREGLETYKTFLARYDIFHGLIYKESFAAVSPFSRLKVRIKKEIIAMGYTDIQPARESAPRLSPLELKQWYEEKRNMILLDARNDYEVEQGTFSSAISLRIHTFREFPAAASLLPAEMKEKSVVTFCTGGIRCEKAALWLQKQGFQDVYQLDGGILGYWAQCGKVHYVGNCFVFDDRMTIEDLLPKRQRTHHSDTYHGP